VPTSQKSAYAPFKILQNQCYLCAKILKNSTLLNFIFQKMQTYISLLRGINIGGRNLIKMEQLRAAYTELGFTAVRSYIQSGNLVFDAPVISQNTDLEAAIRAKIQQIWGFDIPTIVRTKAEIAEICAANPLVSDERNHSELHVVFLQEPKANDEAIGAMLPLRRESELLAHCPDALFLYCPDGYHKSKIHNNYIEKQLATAATTRNWRTCTTILDL
jgi:uncharacterized protein (DUF1697 family)